MEDLKKNKLLWILVGVTLLNFGIFALSKLVVEKASDRVIQKLQKDYSPSPYGPGFDPDKVSPEGLKQNKVQLNQEEPVVEPQVQPSFVQNPPKKQMGIMHLAGDSLVWRSEWEQDRGFSPLQ